MIAVHIFLGVISLFTFMSGFFLNRKEYVHVSSCKDLYTEAFTGTYRGVDVVLNSTLLQSGQSTERAGKCWSYRKKSKVILFIIDALRLDFMIWRNDRVEQNDNKSYNQFKYLDKLRRYNRSNAMMFGFRADSPTTTSQRLKGILTGNFPTFMEIGVNFNSKRIVEDSLMKQWKLNTRRMVMLGDDTWMKLFPSDYFTTSYPFPSFDTTDLDTVDEGIRRYLWGYFTDGGKGKSTLDINCTAVLDSDYGGGGVLNSSPVDWDVLIAHFLGVDHIGHTHSAMHPLMGHRLREMDKVLEEIVEKMSNDSLLLMFGDHGMTNEGEHGGSSHDEKNSGLFVYTKSSLGQYSDNAIATNVSNSTECEYISVWNESSAILERVCIDTQLPSPRMIQQIDFAATMSILSGVPIPFTSIGMIIPELMTNSFCDSSSEDSCDDIGTALLVNALQVMRYVELYYCQSRSGSGFVVANQFKASLQDAINTHVMYIQCMQALGHECNSILLQARLKYVYVIRSVQDFAREQWNVFDDGRMLTGIIGICISIVLTIHELLGDRTLISFTDLSLYFQRRNRDNMSKWLFSNDASIEVLIIAFIALFRMMTPFSNSFIIEEQKFYMFAVQLFRLFRLMRALRTIITQHESFSFVSNTYIAIVCEISAMIAEFENFVVFRTVLTSAILPLGVALNVATYLTSQKSVKWSSFQYLFCYVLNLLCLLSTCAAVARIVLMNVCSDDDAGSRASEGQVISDIKYCEDIIIDTSQVGLVSVLCSFVLITVASVKIRRNSVHLLCSTDLLLMVLMSNCSLLLAIVLHAHKGSALVILALLHWFFVLKSYLKSSSFSTQSVLTCVSLALQAQCVARLMFFLSGHKYDFGTLQLWAGFIGARTFVFWYAGMLVFFNTFLFDFLGMIVCTIMILKMKHSHFVALLILKSILIYNSISLACTMLAVFVLRDHLMLWEIFAPKIIFESSFWIANLIYTIVLHLFVS